MEPDPGAGHEQQKGNPAPGFGEDPGQPLGDQTVGEGMAGGQIGHDAQKGDDAEPDGIPAQDALTPQPEHLADFRHAHVGHFPGQFFEIADDTVGSLHPDLVHALADTGQVGVALGFEALAQGLVPDRQGGGRGIDAIEFAGGQPVLGQGPLPGAHHLLGIVLPGGDIHLVEHVDEFIGIPTANGGGHEMGEGVAHGPGFGPAGVEKHEDQIRQVHDVIGDPKRCRTLGIGVEPGGIDEDHAAQLFAGAGAQADIGIDASAFAGLHLLQFLAHLVEGEPQVGIERRAGQHPAFAGGIVADDRELVVHGMGAGLLHGEIEIVVDERGLAGGKGAQDGNERPPGDLGNGGLVQAEEPQAPANRVQALEAGHRVHQERIFLLEMLLEAGQPVRESAVIHASPPRCANGRNLSKKPRPVEGLAVLRPSP